jgi:hypothetical protein
MSRVCLRKSYEDYRGGYALLDYFVIGSGWIPLCQTVAFLATVGLFILIISLPVLGVTDLVRTIPTFDDYGIGRQTVGKSGVA